MTTMANFVQFSLFLAVAFSITACSIPNEQPSGSSEAKVATSQSAEDILSAAREKFDHEQAAWKAQGLSDYSFIYLVRAPLTAASNAFVTVAGDTITRIDPPADFKARGNRTDDRGIKTVSDIYIGLFNFFEECREIPLKEGEKLVIDIRYNEQYHYPEYLEYGVIPQDISGKVIGGSPVICIEVSDLQPANPAPNLIFDLAKFNLERAAWEAQGVTDSQFRAETFPDAYGDDSANVWVADGKVIQVSDGADSKAFFYEMGSISDIYTRIFNFYEQNYPALKEGEKMVIYARYDEKYHYPRYVEYGIVGQPPFIGAGTTNMAIVLDHINGELLSYP
ncbi:hypothetical protein AGMMS50267_03400 [Spirochaetia bacterium]|nr:hypothetical protein AGMMS50267_03400 [Spirochaetia bacterium]